MRQGPLIGLLGSVMLACSGGPAPTTTPDPTQTPAAQPTPGGTAVSTPAGTGTAAPTPLPSPAPTLSPTPTTSASGAATIAWTERTDVARGPDAREDHTWTVDADGQVAYLFGGRSGDGPQADLWAFDLVRDEWTLLRPSGPGPTPRFGHTATWVPDVGLVVWSGQGRDFFADLWAYDPAVDAWHELPSLGAVPEARYGSCASLGPDGRLWISHGFTQDDGRFADTRAYDFASGEWTDMTPSGDVPVKRCLHDCFWAPDGKLILYGGQTTGVPALGDIWSYDPVAAAWQQGAAQQAPPRQLYALAADPQLGILVFGGADLDRAYLGDTWALDPSGPELHGLSVAGPSGRSGAALIADPGRGFLLFGGQNETGLLGDLWELSEGQ